jgi:penicillin G amidase
MPRQPSMTALARKALAQIDGEIAVPQLRGTVTITRDEWGVPHISAASAEDLFFAQGYVAAQDRLWQMEMWRRAAEGRLAEIAGPAFVERDRVARLLKNRGTMSDEELRPYHPDARRLMSAFVGGVNAFITQHEDRLPVEFAISGIRPMPWTIETLTLRQIAFGDALSELQLARSVHRLGRDEANRRRNPDPWDPLEIPAGLNVALVGDPVVDAARVNARPVVLELLPQFRSLARGSGSDVRSVAAVDPGSNNWVVSGALSATGKPVVVNDPHREVTLPSLRYIVHLQAPGWNVIGAVEPPFLGVAAGHNERLAWGLTIVGTDQHDVYVEEINPANAGEVRWRSGWEPIRIVREGIAVKGAAPRTATLKFTRHGPIFYEDLQQHRAYALRSALHQPGTAPYLAGLRLSQAKDCRDFLAAAKFWNAPSENLICGDVDGNIAWRASALTPSRPAWTGRLPVPGTGAFEWQGFRDDLPQELNPASGFIVTANHNIQPKGYSPPFMFKNADTRFERITRLRQLIVPGRTLSLADHQRMQHDAYSLRAAADLRLFRGWRSPDAKIERARAMLDGWDATYRKDSAAAALYETWRAVIASGRRGSADADDAVEQRVAAAVDVSGTLRRAVASLEATQGSDATYWRWGRMHARAFPHPLAPAFDLPAVERSGGAGTVAADGATYREILDVSDWDHSRATNVPGQSGQPGSPFYGNLLPLWAEDTYFPLLFTPPAIAAHARHRLVLTPARGQN